MMSCCNSSVTSEKSGAIANKEPLRMPLLQTLGLKNGRRPREQCRERVAESASVAFVPQIIELPPIPPPNRSRLDDKRRRYGSI